MARWLHALQQFHFSIMHRPGNDHDNADGLSRVPSSPCRQCTRPDCQPVVSLPDIADQPFDSESTGSSRRWGLNPHPLGRRLGGSTRRWLISTDSYCWWLFSYFDPPTGGSYLHCTKRMDFVGWAPPPPPGLRWRDYIRNFAHCGIIVTTCHWMATELFGGNEVHSVLYYNLNPAGNSSSWLTMPLCLAAMWAGTGHWPA